MLTFVFLNTNPIQPLKEYGSSIQKLVDNMVNIEDREKRTRYAHILVELMRQIHPNMKDGQDYYNKLWDDLYIMSGFTLDVDSPYPPPSPEVLGKKPQQVPYNTHQLKFKHFGRNVELLVAKAISIEDVDEKRAFVSYLARLMKTFYAAWNKESVEDETIFQSLVELSNGKLADEIQEIRTNGFVEGTPRERTGDQPQRIGGNNYRNEGGQGQRGGGQSRFSGNYGNSQNNNSRNNNQRNNPNANQRGGRREGGPYRPNSGGPNRNNDRNGRRR